MTAYVWQQVAQVSDNWHRNGGLLIVAESREHAKALIEAEADVAVTDDEWAKVIEIPCAAAAAPRLMAFPDAGCC